MGLVEAYPKEDKGRSEITDKAAEMYFLKVPACAHWQDRILLA